MIIPTRRLLLLILIGIPMAGFPIFHPGVGPALWIGYLLIVVVLAGADYMIFPRKRSFRCSLTAEKVFYLGNQSFIELQINTPGYFTIQGHLFIKAGGPINIAVPEKLTTLAPGDNTLRYPVSFNKRGNVQFQEVLLRLRGYLGLCWVQTTFSLGLKQKARVVPNIRGVGRYALRFFSDPQMRAGLKVERYRGQGSEFESLREYLPGFDTRTIDWKASARKAKLYCREYRAERNHEIVIVLDCGRLMAAEMDGITKLDHAINALLLMAYLAIKTGDQVGFMAFSDRIKHYLKPHGHLSVLDQISRQCDNISYDFTETNFVIGMEHLLAMQKKRALVIVLTDFVDSISAELMRDYVGLLARRHLVLFVAIRDPFLDANLQPPPRQLIDLHRQVACYHLKDERFKLFSDLKRLGIHCLDVLPHEISVPLVNRYLDIRRREMI